MTAALASALGTAKTASLPLAHAWCLTPLLLPHPRPARLRSIPVDFIEREKEYVLRADIPGVHKVRARQSMWGEGG